MPEQDEGAFKIPSVALVLLCFEGRPFLDCFLPVLFLCEVSPLVDNLLKRLCSICVLAFCNIGRVLCLLIHASQTRFIGIVSCIGSFQCGYFLRLVGSYFSNVLVILRLLHWFSNCMFDRKWFTVQLSASGKEMAHLTFKCLIKFNLSPTIPKCGKFW